MENIFESQIRLKSISEYQLSLNTAFSYLTENITNSNLARKYIANIKPSFKCFIDSSTTPNNNYIIHNNEIDQINFTKADT